VLLLSSAVSTKLEVSTVLLFEKIGGMGRRDGRTADRRTVGRDATLNAAPYSEGHISISFIHAIGLTNELF